MRRSRGFRKFTALAALALPLAVWTAGCGGDAAKTEAKTVAATPAPDATGPILVGEYGSMTGSEATFGVSSHEGIMLAVKEINAKGGVKGRTLEIKSGDDQGKEQEAGTLVTRLITSDKVVAVLGEVASGRSLAGGAVAQSMGVPMISPASTNPKVTEGRDMVSRVCFIDPYQGFVCAKFMRENLKLTSAAVLFDQSAPYSVGLKDAFVKALTDLGGKITVEQAYGKGDQDFNAQLTTIRDTNPDVVFVPGYYTEVGNIAIQARRLNIAVPLIGGDGWDSEELLKIGGEALNGCYYSNHYSSEDQRPDVVEFVTKYKADYNGKVPDTMAALGYDAARILADAMERSPSLGGKDLAAAIAATKDFKGVTGSITLDANRNAAKAAVIIQIKDGKSSYLTGVDPAGPDTK